MYKNKYLQHCTDKKCYEVSFDWKPSKNCTLETEFSRKVSLPVQCCFATRCFVNTTKWTLTLLPSELDFRVAKTDFDTPWKPAVLFYCTQKESLMAARVKAKRNKYTLPMFCHDGPRLTVTAEEVIIGCFSLILQTLSFMQAQKREDIYIPTQCCMHPALEVFSS